jgi:hypothetical protein
MNTATKTPVVLITGDGKGSTGTNAIARILELNVPVRALAHKVNARFVQLGLRAKNGMKQRNEFLAER